jgi:hypothetical protein
VSRTIVAVVPLVVIQRLYDVGYNDDAYDLKVRASLNADFALALPSRNPPGPSLWIDYARESMARRSLQSYVLERAAAFDDVAELNTRRHFANEANLPVGST